MRWVGDAVAHGVFVDRTARGRPGAGEEVAQTWSRPEESWAPTIVGDRLGLAAALLGSLVAVIGAVATRPKRVPAGPVATGTRP